MYKTPPNQIKLEKVLGFFDANLKMLVVIEVLWIIFWPKAFN